MLCKHPFYPLKFVTKLTITVDGFFGGRQRVGENFICFPRLTFVSLIVLGVRVCARLRTLIKLFLVN